MALETIAAGASALGGVMSFKGNRAAARSAQQIAEYNAQLAENEAVLLQRAKTQQEVALRQQNERLRATQRVMTAASGIQMTGNVLQPLADAYFKTEQDALRIRYASDIEQTQKEAEAALARATGAARRSAMNTQAYTSLLGSAYQTAELMRD